MLIPISLIALMTQLVVMVADVASRFDIARRSASLELWPSILAS
jgi:hypothetical protein